MTPDTYDYFDIHSHLNFSDFDADRDEVIAEMKERKIGTITVGTDLASSKEAVELADKYENLFASIGLHPIDDPAGSFDQEDFAALARNPKVVAIGECGLDYSRLSVGTSGAAGASGESGTTQIMTKEKNRQKEEFEKQIEFAVAHDLPLMIHCRDAYPDAISLLQSKKKEHGDKLRGNFHFFTSPIEIARQSLELDFTVSFTGPITFVKEYAEVVAFVPLEKMMSETDAPFATPAPFRGKRNSPLYVSEIVKRIAEIKGLDIDKVKKQLVNNVFELFLMRISSPAR